MDEDEVDGNQDIEEQIDYSLKVGTNEISSARVNSIETDASGGMTTYETIIVEVEIRKWDRQKNDEK